jgi:hypothetical protein
MDPTRLPCKFLTAWWVSHPRCSGGQHYTLQNSYVKTLQHILPNIPDNARHHRFMAAPCAEPWTVENTQDWMDKAPTSTHDLSVWSSSSLRRWHPRSSVPLVLTRHSSPILNERWTWMIKLSMFFYYVMVFLLFWDNEPCIRFSFQQFNAPDALICYPGSIEKLKLLEATYLPNLFLHRDTPHFWSAGTKTM